MNTVRDALFAQNEPVMYKGSLIQQYDRFNLFAGDLVQITILETNSLYKQGISIRVIDPKDKKYLEVQSKKLSGFLLWQDTLPKDGAYVTVLQDCKIAVWNAWEEEDKGKKHVWSAMKNAAMHVEIKNNTRMYRCNDGDNDEDFDDLVFHIKIKTK